MSVPELGYMAAGGFAAWKVFGSLLRAQGGGSQAGPKQADFIVPVLRELDQHKRKQLHEAMMDVKAVNIDDPAALKQEKEQIDIIERVKGASSLGISAAVEGQEHVFKAVGAVKEAGEGKDLMKGKIPGYEPAQVKAAEELLQALRPVVDWAGPGSPPALRKPWGEMTPGDKMTALVLLGKLDWSFIKRAAAVETNLDRDWLWQINEAPPPLAGEPLHAASAGKAITAARGWLTSVVEPDARKLLDKARLGKVRALAAAVAPLDVAGVTAAAAELREACGRLGLPAGTVGSRLTELGQLLRGAELLPEEESLAGAKADAVARLERDATAAGQAEVDKAAAEQASALNTVRTRQAVAGADRAESARTPPLEKLAALSVLCQAAEAAAGEESLREVCLGAMSNLARSFGLPEADARWAQISEQLDALAAGPPPPAPLAADVWQPFRLLDEWVATTIAAAAAPPAAADGNGNAVRVELNVDTATGAVKLNLGAAGAGEHGGATAAAMAAAAAPASTGAEFQALQGRMQRLVEAAVEAERSRLAAGLEALRQSATGRAMRALVEARVADREGLRRAFAAERLALLERFLRLQGEKGGTATLDGLRDLAPALVPQVAGSGNPADSAVALLDMPLSPTSLAALRRVQALVEMVPVVEQVSKLELGPGVCDALRAIHASLPGLSLLVLPSEEARAGAAAAAAKAASLLGSGLVLLELDGGNYKKLAQLREAALALEGQAGDAGAYNKLLTQLRELLPHLGPIGGAVERRGRALQEGGQPDAAAQLATVKAEALAIYHQLNGLLEWEQATMTPAGRELTELKQLVGSLAADAKRAGLVEAAAQRASSAQQKAADVGAKLRASCGGADGALDGLLEDALGRLDGLLAAASERLETLVQYVKLREVALGQDPLASQPPSGAAIVPDLPSFEQLQHEQNEMTARLDAERTALLRAAGALTPEQEAAAEEGPKQPEWVNAGGQDEDTRQALFAQGCDAIAAGRVAVVLIAGGMREAEAAAGAKQVPAGCVDVGLPSRKGLFQLFAERLLRVQKVAAEAAGGALGTGIKVPTQLVVVTSADSHAATVAHFRRHRYFGLAARQVTFVRNAWRAPLLDEAHKVVMERPDHPATGRASSSLDALRLLQREGVLRALERRGVQTVEMHCVEDNLLAKPADPLLLGLMASQGWEAAAKVVEPAALAPIYEHLAAATSSEFWQQEVFRLTPGIGVYAFSMARLKGFASALADLAQSDLLKLLPKAGIPGPPAAAGAAGLGGAAGGLGGLLGGFNPLAARQQAASAPTKVSGYELAGSVSSLMALDTDRSGVVLVSAAEEWAPVWGVAPWCKPAYDTAARDVLLQVQTGWVLAAGGALDGSEVEVVEVSPLVSYGGEDLAGWCEGKTYSQSWDKELQGFVIPQSDQLLAPKPSWALPFLAGYAGLALLKLLRK